MVKITGNKVGNKLSSQFAFLEQHAIIIKLAPRIIKKTSHILKLIFCYLLFFYQASPPSLWLNP